MKKFIKNNQKGWSDYNKPKETVFQFNRTKILYGTNNVYDREEIQGVIERMKNEHNAWKYIKKNITKKSLIKTQMKIWMESKEGKVLKKYKKSWYSDKIIDDINHECVSIIKKLRLGNSPLKSHRKQGTKIGTCVCGKEDETNEHYFLECERYRDERKNLMKSLRYTKEKLGQIENIKMILGFFPEIFKSKGKLKKYINVIKENYAKVFNYIKKTKRFQ